MELTLCKLLILGYVRGGNQTQNHFTNFVMLICLGAVELAAAGVSIALFNQASKISVFPLVSVTTSFVAEEETIERMNIKAAENDSNNNNNNKSKLNSEVTPEDHVHQDIEKGALKENTKEAPKEYDVGNNDKTNRVGKLSLSLHSLYFFTIYT